MSVKSDKSLFFVHDSWFFDLSLLIAGILGISRMQDLSNLSAAEKININHILNRVTCLKVEHGIRKYQ